MGYINMERDDASGSLYVFLEYVSGGSIHSMLERFGRFSEPLVRVYTRQLLQVNDLSVSVAVSVSVLPP